MENPNSYVVGIGELLWDIFPDRKVAGGAPANFAWHVSQFGLNGVVISAVGNDKLGCELVSVVEDKGLGHCIEKVSKDTGTVYVELDACGIPSYTITEDTACDNIPLTERILEIAADTRTVCFGSLAQREEVSRSTIKKFVEKMPTDSLKIFDINLRQDFYTKEVIEGSLEICNVLKVNDEELPIVSDIFSLSCGEEARCREIMDRWDLRYLILTKGSNGSTVYSKNEVSDLPTPKVKVADTVGAGDSFTASFTASILLGKSLRQAHQTAVDVAAYVCSTHGATPILPRHIILN